MNNQKMAREILSDFLKVFEGEFFHRTFDCNLKIRDEPADLPEVIKCIKINNIKYGGYDPLDPFERMIKIITHKLNLVQEKNNVS